MSGIADQVFVPGRRNELLPFVLSKDPDPGERIDYVFVSDSILVRSHCTCIDRRPAGYLSDHLPVCADIVLR